MTVSVDRSLVRGLPKPAAIRERLGDALREVRLLRGLLRLAERAETYRRCDEARRSG